MTLGTIWIFGRSLKLWWKHSDYFYHDSFTTFFLKSLTESAVVARLEIDYNLYSMFPKYKKLNFTHTFIPSFF